MPNEAVEKVPTIKKVCKQIGGTQKVSRSEIVASKPNTEIVFFVNFSLSLSLQTRRSRSAAALGPRPLHRVVRPRLRNKGESKATRRAVPDLLAVQMLDVYHRSKFQEHIGESIRVFTPVDHSTGHWCPFAPIPPIDKKPQTGVIEKRDSCRSSPDAELPVPGIRGNRYKCQHFRPMFPVRVRTPAKPVLDCGAAFSIRSVGGVDVDLSEVPTFLKAVLAREPIFHLGMNN